jgi:hypothetical protein
MDKTTKLIHYTNGGPWFEEYKDHVHADVWYAMRDEMKAAQAGLAPGGHVAMPDTSIIINSNTPQTS